MLKRGGRQSCYLPESLLVLGWCSNQRVTPICSHRPHTCRGDTKHWSSATYRRSPCGRNESMATPSTHHYLHTLPSKCNKPVRRITKFSLGNYFTCHRKVHITGQHIQQRVTPNPLISLFCSLDHQSYYAASEHLKQSKLPHSSATFFLAGTW